MNYVSSISTGNLQDALGGDEDLPDSASQSRSSERGQMAESGLAQGSPPRQGNASAALRRRKGKGGSSKRLTEKERRAYSAEQQGRAQRPGGQKAGPGRGSKRSSWSSENRRGPLDEEEAGDRQDFAAMVANFESGSEIARLRAELAASQQSMADSKSALKSAATEYFRSHNG